MPSRVQLYATALRRQQQAQRAVGAVTGGVFLGLLDRRHLAELDRTHYDGASELVAGVERAYADEAMVHSGLFGWERDLTTAHFPAGGRVAVVAAGAGREVLALLEAGFDAHGFEPHPRLAREGAEVLAAAGYPGRVRESPRDVFPDVDGDFDAVVVGWGAYSLIAASGTRIAMLRGARSRLAPGAPLLLSFMLRPPGSRYLELVHGIAAPIRRLRRAEAPEPGDCLLPNFVHYFAPGAIRSELAAGGFGAELEAAEPYGHALARAL